MMIRASEPPMKARRSMIRATSCTSIAIRGKSPQYKAVAGPDLSRRAETDRRIRNVAEAIRIDRGWMPMRIRRARLLDGQSGDLKKSLCCP